MQLIEACLSMRTSYIDFEWKRNINVSRKQRESTSAVYM